MTTINHECYVSLEIGKLLKKVGFDWKCNGAYLSEDGTQYAFVKMDEACDNNNSKYNQYNISAPTLDVAQRWLREIKNCQVEIMYTYNKYVINMGKYVVIYTVRDKIHGSLVDEETEQPIKLFEMYEKAQEAGIKKVLEIILEKEE